jgi:4-hydroxyproline betaine 2-epimerase
MAKAKIRALDTTLVKFVADTGLVGWGETCPVCPTYQPAHPKGARGAREEMGPGLIGSTLHSVTLQLAMESLLNGHGHAKRQWTLRRTIS